MAGGAILEGIGGIAVIALAIVGLAGVLSREMAGIASIILGAAMLIEGGAFAASQYEVFRGEGGTAARFARWSQSLDAGFLGALAGVVLGILSLLGIAPLTLVSVAALVFGATFACSAFSAWGSSKRVSVGLAGLVLGLLAVCGLSSLTLVLVAFLCLGSAAIFSGAATSATMVTETHQRPAA
ncbi:MAG TPA: hypothetical protein VMU04_08540 [Candidatus Acidoferrum sp.]|nr:hypothetical protein [Candidatus Acidoferrum sp.]